MMAAGTGPKKSRMPAWPVRSAPSWERSRKVQGPSDDRHTQGAGDLDQQGPYAVIDAFPALPGAFFVVLDDVGKHAPGEYILAGKPETDDKSDPADRFAGSVRGEKEAGHGHARDEKPQGIGGAFVDPVGDPLPEKEKQGRAPIMISSTIGRWAFMFR